MINPIIKKNNKNCTKWKKWVNKMITYYFIKNKKYVKKN